MKKIMNLAIVAALAAIALVGTCATLFSLAVFLTYANTGAAAGLAWGFGFIASLIATIATWSAFARRAKAMTDRILERTAIPTHESYTATNNKAQAA